MNISPEETESGIASFCGAAQHSPRPLPLLLDHFRTVCGDNHADLDAALAGLVRYQKAERDTGSPQTPRVAAHVGPARLLEIGSAAHGDRSAVMLIPSIINGPQILNLAPDYSFAAFLAAAGHRVLLLDWGPVDAARAKEGLAAQITDFVLPLVNAIGQPAHLVGYCLGGLHAMAAAQLGHAKSIAMIASPWDFSGYDQCQRDAMGRHWDNNRTQCDALSCTPTEVLQTAFWELDPTLLATKFANAATMDDRRFSHFVRVEDWANGGEALPLRATHDIFDHLFCANMTGTGQWSVGGQIIAPDSMACPALSVRSRTDRIVPFGASPRLSETLDLEEGHVGMMIGSRRKTGLWSGVLDFIRRADTA